MDFHNSVTPAEHGAALSRPDQALKNVLDILDELDRPVYHMIGNHCLYNHPRHILNAKLAIVEHQGAAEHSYYSVVPHPGWRFVVLDGYDVSLLGWPPGHPYHEAALKLLDEKNPNEVGGAGGACRASSGARAARPRGRWHGMSGERAWHAYRGGEWGLGARQDLARDRRECCRGDPVGILGRVIRCGAPVSTDGRAAARRISFSRRKTAPMA